MSTYADSAPYNINSQIPDDSPKGSTPVKSMNTGNKRRYSSKNSKNARNSTNGQDASESQIRATSRSPKSAYQEQVAALDQEAIKVTTDTFDDISSLLLKFKEKTLYFRDTTLVDLENLTPKLKLLKGTKLNVDPGDGEIFSGNIIFGSAENTQRAFAVLNGYIDSKIYSFKLSVDKDLAFNRPQTETLRIAQLPDDTDITTLYDLLRVIGPISSISFNKQPESKLTNYGYVQYFERDAADNVIAELTYANYMNNLITFKKLRSPTKNRKSDALAINDNKPNPPKQEENKKSTPLNNHTIDQSQLCNITQNISKATQPSSTQNQPFTLTDVKTLSNATESSQTTSLDLEAKADQTHFGLGGILVPGKLFVRNLDPTVSHSDLFQLFKKYGYIHSARVNINPVTKISMCHGVVQMGSPEHAKKALDALNGVELKGRKLSIYLYEHIPKDRAESPNVGHGAVSPNTRRLSNKSDSTYTPTRKEQSKTELLDPISTQSLNKISAFPAHVANSSPASSPTKPLSSNLAQRLGSMSILNDSNLLPVTPPATKKTNTPSKSTNSTPGSIFDPTVLTNLSKPSYVEILSKKIISEAIDNPMLDKSFAPEIITYLVSLPLDRVLNIINSHDSLNSEWNSAQGKFSLNNLDPQALNIVCSSWAKSSNIEGSTYALTNNNYHSPLTPASSSEVTKPVQSPVELQANYDEECEKYIEQLLSKPEPERKQKLGARLFPLIKGLGFANPTKLTVWILDHLLDDIRHLVYAMNDSIQLQQIIKDSADKMNQG